MKSIHTLIPDIYDLVGKRTGWFDEVLASDLGREITLKVTQRFSAAERKRGLRLSAMGNTCPCALWHSVNRPELTEPMPGWAHIKFMYGDILEALVISLAKATGHTVEGEQDAVSVDGIVGHRDCVIDGYLVDVKSANSRSFEKFVKKTLATDPFSSAYLDQLDGYLVGCANDPIVLHKDRGYLLAIDKVLGHMVLYEHKLREASIRSRIASYKEIVARPQAPVCECREEPDGSSGNYQLDLKASYNNFKYCCKPHLRTFLYSGGPRYLTRVVKRPKNANGFITEIDRNGKEVFG